MGDSGHTVDVESAVIIKGNTTNIRGIYTGPAHARTTLIRTLCKNVFIVRSLLPQYGYTRGT